MKLPPWLGIVFGIQLFMFMAFIYGFFTFEHQHEREEHELMSELEVLRKQNMEVSKKLVEAEKRFIRRFDDDAVEEAGDDPEGNNAMEYDESDDEEAAAAELSEASARAASLAARMPQGANGGLGGACARKKVDWWTFEVCVGERVTQFHDADDHGAFEEHFMGGWVGAAVDVSRGGRVDGAALWRLQYKHGERCDGGEERTVEVELRCAERPASPGFVITDVHEPSICHYRIGAVAPASRCVGLDALRPSAAVAEAVARATATGGRSGGGGGQSGGARALAASTERPRTAAAAARAVTLLPVAAAGENSAASLATIPISGDTAAVAKRGAVINALRHAWKGYEAHAWGADELKPVSRGRTDWVGLGLTIIDSLDSLYLAGLNAELEHALSWVRTSLNFHKSHKSHTPHVASSHPARHSRVHRFAPRSTSTR